MAVEELGLKFIAEGFSTLERALDKLTDLTDDSASSMDDLNETSQEMSDKLGRLEDALSSIEDVLIDMAYGFDKTEQGADEATQSEKEFATATDKAGKEAEKTSNILESTLAVALGNILAKAAEVAMQALYKLGEAAVSAFKESFSLAVDFESSLSRLEIAAKSSGLSFDQLHDAAIRVGGDANLIGVSATGAAEAMEILFKAGLNDVQMFGDLDAYMQGAALTSGALKASIDLAAASELDMVQASELAAVTLATFGSALETDEEKAQFVTGAMDNFVKSADASVASVSDLAAAMGNVGPTAASFGFSLEDTNNALAILSTRGINGAEAGTALKSMMTNLMRPTNAVQGALDELNVSLFNTDGTMKELPQIIGEFEKSMAGLTEEERLNYIQTLAGTFGMKAFSTLLEEGTEGWNEMAEATANATGISAQAAAMSETFKGKMEAFDGVIETLKIQLGEAFLPVATDFLMWVTEMAEKHGPAIVAAFEQFGAVLSEKLPIAIQTVSDLWNNVLYPALVLIWDFIQNYVIPVLTFLWDMFNTKGPEAANTITTAWNSIVENATIIFEALKLIVSTALEAISTWWTEHGDSVMTIVNFLMGNIQSVISTVLAVIQAVVTTVLDAVRVFWEQHGEAIMANATLVWNTIKTVIETILGIISGIIDAVALAIQGDWRGFGETLRTVWDQAWQAIVKVLTNMGQVLINLVQEAVKSVISLITETDWAAVGDSIVQGIANGIAAGASAIANAAKAAAQAALDAAKGLLGIQSPSIEFMKLGANIDEGMAQGIAALQQVPAEAMKRVAAGVMSAAQVRPAIAGAGTTNNSYTYYYNNPAYNLTTQSVTRPGGLQMEFEAMSLVGR